MIETESVILAGSLTETPIKIDNNVEVVTFEDGGTFDLSFDNQGIG